MGHAGGSREGAERAIDGARRRAVRATASSKHREERGSRGLSVELVVSRRCSRRSSRGGEGQRRGGHGLLPQVLDTCSTGKEGAPGRKERS